jgi:hypothetical protein
MQEWSLIIEGMKGISKYVKDENRAINQKQTHPLLWIASNELAIQLERESTEVREDYIQTLWMLSDISWHLHIYRDFED